MSKHDRLQIQELESYTPPKRTRHCLEQLMSSSESGPGGIRALDWGCGRGLWTLWLREQGCDAYGVDVSELPISNGRALFVERGHPADSLRVLDSVGRTDFPDAAFDVIVSNQVFEHVSDIDSVAREMWRLLRPGGIGYHVFPAHKYFVEGHLFMPLVHWLPKNRARKLAIHFFTQLGKEPRWPQLDGENLSKKAAVYYQYSIDKTFYRTPSRLREVFVSQGFEVSFETINHPRVQNHWLLGRMARNRTLAPVVDFMLLNFVSNELRLYKPEQPT